VQHEAWGCTIHDRHLGATSRGNSKQGNLRARESVSAATLHTQNRQGECQFTVRRAVRNALSIRVLIIWVADPGFVARLSASGGGSVSRSVNHSP
jgi:hypothetical protein